MKEKIRDWKGLFTNVDTVDIKPNYLRTFKNARIKPGYIESDFLTFEQLLISDIEGEIKSYSSLLIDDDKLSNGLNENNELVFNYSYNVQKLEFIVTYHENTFKVYYKIEGGEWIQIEARGQFNETDYLKGPNGNVLVQNVNGTAKIFLPHTALWFGKISRTYWISGIPSFSGFYLTRLSEFFDYKLPTIQEVDGRYFLDSNHSLGIRYDLTVDKENQVIDHEVRMDFISISNNPDPVPDFAYFRLQILETGEIRKVQLRAFQVAPNEWYVSGGGIPASLHDMNIHRDTDPLTPGYQGDWVDSQAVAVEELESESYQGLIFLHKTYDSASYGLPFTKYKAEIVSTITLDEKDEFVIDRNELIFTEVSPFFIKVTNIRIPEDLNRRVSRISFYISFNDEDDHERVKSYFFIEGARILYSNGFFIGKLSPEGIFLSQMIGKTFAFKTHKLITQFTDYNIANGVAYGISNGNLYYPDILNGLVSENVFYDSNIIPYISKNPIEEITNIKEILSVHSKNEMKLIITQDAGVGEFLFGVKDSIGYGVTDRRQLAETPDGLLILTKQGIFITNGQEDVLISEPINDIVELNYNVGGLIYNPTEKQILFYLIGTTQLYVYDYLTKSWSEKAVNHRLSYDETFINFNNEIIVRDGNQIYRLFKGSAGVMTIELHSLDFGDLEARKILKSVSIDFQGIIRAYDKDVENQVRGTKEFIVSLSNRTLKRKIDFGFVGYDSVKIYNIELNWDIAYEKVLQ